MRLFINSIKLLFFILVIFYSINYIYAQGGNDKTLKILWQKDFGCVEGLSCSPGAITFSSTDNTLLIMGTSFRPKVYSDAKFWLWEINEKGEKIKDTVIKEIHSQHKSDIQQGSELIKDLTISKNNDIFAVGEFDGNFQSFMKMNREGKIIFSKNITEENLGGVNSLISKIINLPDSNFLLIGRDVRSQGLIIKIDSEGNKIWKKVYDTGQCGLFTDGMPIENNGDFLIVGCFGKREETSLIGASNVWMLRCNVEGEIVTEKKFQGNPLPGRQPHLCQLGSGNFVVAYDGNTQMMSMNTDHRIRAVSPDLKLLWDKEVVKSEKAPPTFFRITDIPGDGFILADCINFSDLIVYEYNKKGNRVGSLSMDKVIWLSNFSLTSTKNKVFILLQTLSKSDDTISELKILAIEPNKWGELKR